MAAPDPACTVHSVTTFQIGDAVNWSGDKAGKVVAVVPTGRLPRDVGCPNLGEFAVHSGHESYVVRGGRPGEEPTDHWPLPWQMTMASPPPRKGAAAVQEKSPCR